MKHVLVIGYDGLSPAGLQAARAPQIHGVRARGAYSWHARGVMPTSSSPNWASMIMGAGPEQHGVTSNDWMPDRFDIAPVVKGPGGIFPHHLRPAAGARTLRRNRQSSTSGRGFARLVEPGAANHVDHPGTRDADETVRRAVAYIPAHKPRLTFVHLDLIDHAGHKSGHGSPAYLAAIEKADTLTGLLLAAVEQAGMMPGTLVLLTADHGGLGRKHGGATMAEIEIPWIVSGPGVVAGREIRGPINIWDTAATLAHVLRLKPPAAWLGKPVLEAFAKGAR